MNEDLLTKLDNYIAVMAPHQRERVGGQLLIEARDALRHREALLDDILNECKRGSDPDLHAEPWIPDHLYSRLTNFRNTKTP